jgi:hypothetical protein
MTEIQVVFGTDRHMVGTLTLPDPGEARQVAVLLYNAGVIPRMGPHRLNVKLARALGRLGIVSLRFDLSGQGDSRVPTQAQSFEQQAVVDLQAAMDHVERICNVQRFLVGGICSGAHNGLAAALESPRVVGLWMLDGHAYPTLKTLWFRHAHGLARAPFSTLARWSRRLLHLALAPLRKQTTPPVPRVASLGLGLGKPSREAFAESMQTLVDRDVDVLVLYSASAQWDYNHKCQWNDAFKAHTFVGDVRCEYLPTIDHTATRMASQQLLIGKLSEWAVSVCDRPQHTVW